MIGPSLTYAMLLAGSPVEVAPVRPDAPVAQAAEQAVAPVAPTIDAASPPSTPPGVVVVPTLSKPPVATHIPTGENDIVVQARPPAPPGDPLQALNAKSFEITQSVDRAIVRPIALTYQRILPDPLRSGIRNVLNNLREPVVFLNFLLQHKIGKAFETVGRFGVNSTLGAAGLFDVARKKPFHLPRRRNGLGNTLGFYGVKPGPFFYLPIFGPTDLRDLLGDNLDRLVLPAVAGSPFNKPVYAISIGIFSSLDQRAEFDEKLQELHEGSDPYAKTREDYLRSRQAAIDELHRKRSKVAPVQTPPPLPGVP
ncbi:MAG: VacJ family lipoprotein [Sphingomonadales bacterium]|nr:VacJ family lipoprotein [Sphingomonadales bacterium]